MGLKIERYFTLLLLAAATVGALPFDVSAARDGEPAKAKRSGKAAGSDLTLDDDEKPAPAPETVKLSAEDEARLQKAIGQERASDWTGVIATLKPIADALPRKGLLMLSRAYGARKDWFNQTTALAMLAGKGDHDYYVLTMLGEAYLRKAEGEDPGARARDLDSAAGAFREAIDANKKYRPAFEGLLATLEKLEDRFEARSVLNDMIKKFGPRPAYLSSLCRLYSVESFIDKALETCRSAIELDAKNPDNHVYLGLSLRDKEEEAQAEKTLSSVAQRFPTSEFAQWAAGQVAFEKKNYVSSYRFFAAGAAADAASARSWLGAGKAALELDRPQEAFDSLLRACELDRLTLADYKKAAGQLRQRKRDDWADKFEGAEARCGSKQKK